MQMANTSVPGAEHRSRWIAAAWLLWGLGASLSGGGIGALFATSSIDLSEDFAILIVAAMAFIGWFVGGIVGVAIAQVVEHADRSPAGAWSRTALAFSGFLLPLALLLIAVFVPQLVMGG